MLRFAGVAVLAALVFTVPSAAQVGTGRIKFESSAGLFSINPDGTDLRLIKATECPEPRSPSCFSSHSSRWSPDGSQLAFVRQGRIFVMNAGGGGERAVTTSGPPALFSRHPWSPDGTRIAFVGTEFDSGGRGDIYTVDQAGGVPQRLTADVSEKSPPEWSPDGSELVYSGKVRDNPYGSALFVVPADGGSAPRQITAVEPDYVAVDEPIWSPAGDLIGFRRRTSEAVAGALYVIRRDGTGLRMISSAPPEFPAWSPDGSKIAYSTGVNSNRVGGVWDRDLYVASADGSGERRITFSSEHQWRDVDPAWSQDSKRLSFASMNRPEAGAFDTRPLIFTVNADGTCEAPLAGGHEGWSADWQPAPNAPAVGKRRCRDLAVSGRVVDAAPKEVQLQGEVFNHGTESLNGVSVTIAPGPGASLTAVAAAGKRCPRAGNAFSCPLAQLGRGKRIGLDIRAAARRVTVSDNGRPRFLRVGVAARVMPADLSLVDHRINMEFFVLSCTVAHPGSGAISGTPDRDTICGRRGADRILAGSGPDQVNAGAGPDSISGGGDRDRLFGGRGNDRIYAVDGRVDRIACGPGRDRVVADRRDRVARDCERVTRR